MANGGRGTQRGWARRALAGCLALGLTGVTPLAVDVAPAAATPSAPQLLPTNLTLTPSSAARRGGRSLTIAGTGLQDVTAVRLGGIAVTIEDRTATRLGVTSPALALGTHVVELDTPDGTTAVPGGLTATPNHALAPTGLAASRVGPDVTVTWTPPSDLGDLPIDHVQVQLRLLVPWYVNTWDTVRTQSVPADATAAVFTDLPPGRSYYPHLWYVDAEGDGMATALPLYGTAGVNIGVPWDTTPFPDRGSLLAQHLVDVRGPLVATEDVAAALTSIQAWNDLPAWLAAEPLHPAWATPRAPAIRLYQAYFGRLPDTQGLAYWARRREAGVTVSTISSGFAASSEFRSTYGHLTDGAFVDLVYANVLHRSPDAGGRAHWVRRLAAGTSRGAVMVQFSESSEHTTSLAPTVQVVLVTAAMLGRAPTVAEVAHGLAIGAPAYAAEIQHGGEYAARFPADPTLPCRTERRTVALAVESYVAEHGARPATIQVLIDGGYLQEAPPHATLTTTWIRMAGVCAWMT